MHIIWSGHLKYGYFENRKKEKRKQKCEQPLLHLDWYSAQLYEVEFDLASWMKLRRIVWFKFSLPCYHLGRSLGFEEWNDPVKEAKLDDYDDDYYIHCSSIQIMNYQALKGLEYADEWGSKLKSD